MNDDNQACCAHCKVELKHTDHADGTRSDYWECADGCGTKFWPAFQKGFVEKAIGEADRRAGAAERKLEQFEESERKHNHWILGAKLEAGAHPNTSFDIIWEAHLKDRKRLDWLEENQVTVFSWTQDDQCGEPTRKLWQCNNQDLSKARDNIRDAIDAASETHPSEKRPD